MIDDMVAKVKNVTLVPPSVVVVMIRRNTTMATANHKERLVLLRDDAESKAGPPKIRLMNETTGKTKRVTTVYRRRIMAPNFRLFWQAHEWEIARYGRRSTYFSSSSSCSRLVLMRCKWILSALRFPKSFFMKMSPPPPPSSL